MAEPVRSHDPAAAPSRPRLEMVADIADPVAVDDDDVGRSAAIGAVIGFVVATVGVSVIGTMFSDIGIGAAIGLGLFIGMWGGLGFGFMLGGSIPLARRLDRA